MLTKAFVGRFCLNQKNPVNNELLLNNAQTRNIILGEGTGMDKNAVYEKNSAYEIVVCAVFVR
ncbi:hypothetical protein GCM10008013_16790 [Paenibacillus segetis]|uniref:Uncharacterized protein n=1 Tax=Paenibacillus segetis TaxID=1325360 RepID=A0ABQ1YCP4_9BACL|nr:hypothetical protein GCM10008013_16790 [Paenibacillus segetis]